MILSQDFREAIASMAAAVNVITTNGPAGCHGMTATAVCSVSDDPPSVLVCVNRQARMHDVLLANGRFCLNVLAAGQEGVSAAFASRDMDIEQRLAASGGVQMLDADLPALTQAQVAMACRISERFDGSTHTIYVGVVEQLVFGEGRDAMCYYKRQYHAIRSLA